MKRACWRDAAELATLLSDGDRRLLALLTRMPLLPVGTLARFAGLRGGAAVYRRLERLRSRGLAANAAAALAAGRSPALWHPTDLGLGVVALSEGVEPGALARHHGLRESDFLAQADRLPWLLALYELVAALAAAWPGKPELVAWTRPWRTAYARPRAKRAGHIALPAGIALRWGGESRAFLLLPDIGAVPVRAFRRVAGQLLACRADLGAALPPLLVATVGRRRADAWVALLDEAATAWREEALDARVVTWERLRVHPARLLAGMGGGAATLPPAGRQALPPLRPQSPGRPLPQLVGRGLPAGGPSPAEWALLDLIGRHPFLPSDRLHAALGAPAEATRRRRNRLLDLGLARLIGREEIGDAYARRELVELTATGLARLAARQNLTLAEAVRCNGLAGGGPASPVGNRRQLLATLEHTLGADATFLDLHRSCRKGTGTTLVEWRNAACCARGRVRPDGYGLLHSGGRLHGFFLEFDRGTMRRRDYGRKFAAYYHYRERGRYARDYEGYPSILFVTTADAEGRIAAAALEAGTGREPTLPIFLTTRELLDRAVEGLLGPIWRPVANAARSCWPRR